MFVLNIGWVFPFQKGRQLTNTILDQIWKLLDIPFIASVTEELFRRNESIFLGKFVNFELLSIALPLLSDDY